MKMLPEGTDYQELSIIESHGAEWMLEAAEFIPKFNVTDS